MGAKASKPGYNNIKYLGEGGVGGEGARENKDNISYDVMENLSSYI